MPRSNLMIASTSAFLVAAAPADDAGRYVSIQAGGVGSVYCTSPQVVANSNAHHYIRVTITDRYNAAGYGSGVGNQQYRIGPSEVHGIGCHTTSGSGSPLTIHEFSIANAVFAD